MLNEQKLLENYEELRREYHKWRKSDLIEFILELTEERLKVIEENEALKEKIKKSN